MIRTARYRASNGLRSMQKWIVPFLASRVRSTEFRPVLSYLFTEWKCNVNCHYCYTYDNSVEGMTLGTAIRSMDWLHTTGCRVIAIMGGEPLLRKDFILEVVRYGTRRGFFVYLPTNGLLLDEDFVDRVGEAGVAAINLAIDCMEPKPGLPKAFSTIESQFQTLVERQERHGFLMFLNVNLTSKNLQDARQLVQLAADYKIGIDFHVNEPPLIPQHHYRHHGNDTYILPHQYDELDDLLDHLSERNRAGQNMINTVAHLQAMKAFARGIHEPWTCRAGHNSSAIRIDGSLSPCFGMYSSSHDWGDVYRGHRFDSAQLDAMKTECSKHCLSTCQYNMGYFYSHWSILRWVGTHSTTGGSRAAWRLPQKP